MGGPVITVSHHEPRNPSRAGGSWEHPASPRRGGDGPRVPPGAGLMPWLLHRLAAGGANGLLKRSQNPIRGAVARRRSWHAAGRTGCHAPSAANNRWRVPLNSHDGACATQAGRHGFHPTVRHGGSHGCGSKGAKLSLSPAVMQPPLGWSTACYREHKGHVRQEHWEIPKGQGTGKDHMRQKLKGGGFQRHKCLSCPWPALCLGYCSLTQETARQRPAPELTSRPRKTPALPELEPVAPGSYIPGARCANASRLRGHRQRRGRPGGRMPAKCSNKGALCRSSMASRPHACSRPARSGVPSLAEKRDIVLPGAADPD